MSSPTVSQIMAQRSQFSQAYYTGQITQAQYDTAMSFTSKQLQALQPAPTQNPTQPTQQAPAIPNPNPPDIAANQPVTSNDQAGLYINSNYNITNQQTETLPSGETQTTYTIEPKPSAPTIPQQANPESPLSQGALGSNPDIFKNTGIAGVTPVINTKEKATTATQVVAIAAAPAIAPAIGLSAGSVIAGQALGVGINEGISYIQTGKFLSPSQVVASAAEGGIFALVGGKALQLTGLVGKTGLMAAGGRVAVNTGLGAAFGTGAEYLETGKVTGEGALQGAAFGAAFGLAGEVGSRIHTSFNKTPLAQKINNQFGNLQERIFGGKATEIIGANEIRSELTSGKTTKISQLTEPVTRDVTLRGKELSYYKQNNLATMNQPTIDLVGTEKVYQPNYEVGGKKLEPIPTLRQTESTRNAEPFLAAVRKEPYKMVSVKTGKVNDFIETPSDMPAIRKAAITTDFTKGQPPGVLAKKTVISQRNALLPENRFIAREYTGVKISGKIDPQIYASAAKAVPDPIAQDIYKNLGGGYKQMVDFGTQQPKDLHGPMKSFTNAPKTSAPFTENKTAKTSNILNTTTETAKPREVTLPRAIVNVKSPQPFLNTRVSTTIPVNPFTRTTQNQQTEEETTYYSTPNSGLTHPQQPKFMTTQNQKQPVMFNQQQSPSNPLAQSNQRLTSPNGFENTKNKIGYESKQAASQTPIFAPINITKPKTTNTVSPITIPKTAQTTPEYYNRGNKEMSAPFSPFGSKGSEFGGNSQAYPNFVGLRSTKRQYDILTAEEFLGY